MTEYQTKYQIAKLSQMNRSQMEQAAALYIEGFYNIYSKTVSKDKSVLQQLFINAFDRDRVFVCLDEKKVIGFLGFGDIHKRAVCLNKETCQRLFGQFKGAVIYLQMGAILHKIVVHDRNEGYFDYLTTDSSYRGKGVATILINYACNTLPFKQYTLDVLSKNTNAKKLYEHLGFEPLKISRNLFVMLSGFGSQITMKLELGETKKYHL